LTRNLESDEFTLPGQVLADIVVAPPPLEGADGSISFGIEALTIQD